MNININRKLEILTNLGIVALAVILAFMTINHYFFNNTKGNAGRIGASLSLQNVAWSKKPETLLLIMRTDCGFCRESLPFYKRVTEALRNKNQVQVIALFPKSDTGVTQYIRDSGLIVDAIIQESINSLGVKLVPTILLISDKGKIANEWTGGLSQKQQIQMLKVLGIEEIGAEPSSGTLLAQSNDLDIPLIKAQELKRRLDMREEIVLLDVRDREEYSKKHIKGAINIPVDELRSRANRELSQSGLIVIYDSGSQPAITKIAASSLIEKNFQHILLLSEGLNAWIAAGFEENTAS